MHGRSPGLPDLGVCKKSLSALPDITSYKLGPLQVFRMTITHHTIPEPHMPLSNRHRPSALHGQQAVTISTPLSNCGRA